LRRLLVAGLLICSLGTADVARAAGVPQTTGTTHVVTRARGASAALGARTVDGNVGINVDGVVDYAVESYFVDAMKQSRAWGSPNSPWDGKAPIDSNGWPTADAGLLALCCIADPVTNVTLLGGTYQLTFTGQADVSFIIYQGNVSNYAYNAATNTSTALVNVTDTDPGTTIFLSFLNTRRSPSAPLDSGITNVKLIRPQTAPNGQTWWTNPTQTFTTPYLNLLAPFSTLRFMDWVNSNGNPSVNWRDRTPRSFASQQRPNGASWEYAILLCNTLHKDMWVNVPVGATDAYVRDLANLIRTSLDPNLNVYVEFSNEVWNSSFPQFFTNLNAAIADVASNPASPLAYDGDTDKYDWAQRRVGLRLMQISNIFAAVFGRSAIGARVRPVYATQVGATYYLDITLGMIAAVFGPPAKFFYGVAQAPYWNGVPAPPPTLDVDQVLADSEVDLQNTPGHVAGFAAWSLYYGLHNLTYEGGPGMSGNNANLPAMIGANRDPRMGGQVSEALSDFFTNGGDLYVYFNDAGDYGQYGMWGTTENVFVQNTPKLTAIDATANQPFTRTVGAPIPSDIPAQSFEVQPVNAGFEGVDGTNGPYFYFRKGGIKGAQEATVGYLIDAPVAGTYNVDMTVGNYYSTAATASLALNSQAPLGSFTIPGNDSIGNAELTNTVALPLPAGLNVLTIALTSGEFALFTIHAGTDQKPNLRRGLRVRRF
jgi:hypothetical protein